MLPIQLLREITACDSYIWLGTTLYNKWIYDSLFTNSSGCDSLVV